VKSVAIFGAGGQLGHALTGRLSENYAVHALARDRCDVTNPSAVRMSLEEIRPEIIVNASAYTNVEAAEDNETDALAVNAGAAGNLARAARHMDALLISYSTDFVFDGLSYEPYGEAAPVAPINAYGRTKLAGEEAIAAEGGQYIILRTAWLYSTDGHNFFKTVLRLAADQEVLRFVDDQTGTPTSAGWLAAATADMLDATMNSDIKGPVPSIIHAVCCGEATWYDFACSIIEGARIRGAQLPVREISPISSLEYPTRARRPRYSVLSTQSLRNKWKIDPPDWQAMLAIELDKLYGASAQGS